MLDFAVSYVPLDTVAGAHLLVSDLDIFPFQRASSSHLLKTLHVASTPEIAVCDPH